MNIGDRDNRDPITSLQEGAKIYRRPSKTPQCPDEDALRRLVPGNVDPGEAQELLGHAAGCDWCGTVLREAVQDLSDPPSDEERETARKTKWDDPRDRRRLAKLLAGSERRSTVLWWWPAAAGVAVSACVGLVGYQQWAHGIRHTSTLLARAYTEHRQMDARLPGAAHSPKHTAMGFESSRFEEPAALMDAAANIKRGVAKHPDDPDWLRLEGQAELLENREDSAIAELELARSLRPSNPAILTDLGVAYLQKAQKNGDDPEWSKKALEAISEGARLKPDDPVLAFNRALAAEQFQAPSAAREAWEKYLKLDSNGGWASEAREHLEQLKKRLGGSGNTPLEQPATR